MKRSLPRSATLASLFCLALTSVFAPPRANTAEETDSPEKAEQRLYESAKYLASDELEGRGVGTKGLDLAADYLAGRFQELGLKTQLFDGRPFQPFTMIAGVDLGAKNEIAFFGPAPGEAGAAEKRFDPKMGIDFTPMSIGGSGEFDLPLVFAGYGITAKDEGYDDYANIDAKGKIVLILRREPEQTNPHSKFNGAEDSPYSDARRKIANAAEHGAAAVLICSDQHSVAESEKQWKARFDQGVEELLAAQTKYKEIAAPTPEQTATHAKELERLTEELRGLRERSKVEPDSLLHFRRWGESTDGARLPVVHCRRAPIDELLKAAGLGGLTDLEAKIDVGPTPHSADLPGWRAKGMVSVDRREAEVKNVAAILEGEGPLAEETIVIGAHYDHLGYGGEGSLAPESKDIHNGADDNGSGASGLLEVARQLSRRDKKLPRRVLFLAFTGEEKGLIGSARYCASPLIPLDKTVAMLNLDMIGRLDQSKLIIQGVDTATEFGPIIDKLNSEKFSFVLTKQPGGFGPSDHSSFYAQKVPVMHFFTGTHADYHRPSDDADRLNLPGMRSVTELVTATAVALAEAPARPTFVEAQAPANPTPKKGDRPYFGSIPDLSWDKPGYALSGVAKGGPAEKGGFRKGDVIVLFGESKIGNLDDFDSALRKYKAGDKVPVVVQREGKDTTLEVTLDPPR